MRSGVILAIRNALWIVSHEFYCGAVTIWWSYEELDCGGSCRFWDISGQGRPLPAGLSSIVPNTIWIQTQPKHRLISWERKFYAGTSWSPKLTSIYFEKIGGNWFTPTISMYFNRPNVPSTVCSQEVKLFLILIRAQRCHRNKAGKSSGEEVSPSSGKVSLGLSPLCNRSPIWYGDSFAKSDLRWFSSISWIAATVKVLSPHWPQPPRSAMKLKREERKRNLKELKQLRHQVTRDIVKEKLYSTEKASDHFPIHAKKTLFM